MYNVIDLFAGAGGLSLGFSKNKEFKIVAAVEKDKYARETYLYNHKNEDIKILSDVRDIDYNSLKKSFNIVDVIIGGPPCQGFSNANRQKSNIINSNNILVKEYFRAIKELKPKVFIMENVKMLNSEKHRFYYSEIDQTEIDSLSIELREDQIIIANRKYNDLDIIKIATQNRYKNYLLSNSLYSLLNTLLRKGRDIEKIEKFLEKNLNKLATEIQKSTNDFLLTDLNSFLLSIKESDFSDLFFEKFESFMNFQKGMKILEELVLNKIIVDFSNVGDTIYARVYSYSVIEYIEKVLKGEYKQFSGVVNAINYGVPQKRNRFILTGIRSDLQCDDMLDFYTHKDNNFYTVRDAIEDLENINPEIDVKSDPKKIFLEKSSKTYLKNINDSKLLFNHVITATRETALERFKVLKEGENFHNLEKELKDTYSNPERTQNTIYLRIKYDEPSGTVVNVRKSMWIHPVLDRAISIREAARLQSFPDSFVFKGTKDSQYQQIGNAVPPKLATFISDKVFDILSGNR
ncbi:DNA (cytosine-5-)-methyltransferase [Enterococcus haemoperoxidus ATCC BAA-382]|uniref:Cytosine-specific methyltransferase n=1 Tax=Enterococcus haemoperoxidus ATCC BAA-382 TaxID=1158608 RepID=R2SA59_9ENTE|nr:DNA cytosine methyltransferase [Enterococcus haemoperoxidus]EOH92395.1 DNA (cytosine-5-)-methyltransferase [Enterococcus haemoperoxidus ATCC BAA-382]EOT61761.1 hypothetical protein I583_00743 [Enterococcus haemoperoxidus ATCC BAA-382]OJG53966.1 DNA (cytosine-5-)-methyltransferase [Enterococcus haemoperoxidus]